MTTNTTADNAFATQKISVVVAAGNVMPTLDSVDDIEIPVNSPEQTVNLSGITAGSNEDQPLRVTAGSSNTDLIANLTVDYTSADTTGTLKITPLADQHGVSTITVTVEDGGLDGDLDTASDNGEFSRTFDVAVSSANERVFACTTRDADRVRYLACTRCRVFARVATNADGVRRLTST